MKTIENIRTLQEDLGRWFDSVKAICTVEDSIVMCNGEAVALGNDSANGYIRTDGFLDFNPENGNGCNAYYEVKSPYVFIGAMPNSYPDKLLEATLAQINKNATILKATFDKSDIAENEQNIDLEAFTHVSIVWVRFEIEKIEFFDDCPIDVCIC